MQNINIAPPATVNAVPSSNTKLKNAAIIFCKVTIVALSIIASAALSYYIGFNLAPPLLAKSELEFVKGLAMAGAAVGVGLSSLVASPFDPQINPMFRVTTHNINDIRTYLIDTIVGTFFSGCVGALCAPTIPFFYIFKYC